MLNLKTGRCKKYFTDFGQWTVLILLFALSLMVFIDSCSKSECPQEKIFGVKIYDYAGDFDILFRQWQVLGINTVFVSPALDASPGFRDEAIRHNIKRFLILPVFFDPDTLQVTPDLYAITDKGQPAREEWVEFVCPNNEGYRENKLARIGSLIRDLQPDGISIDFIRYFAFWEKIYPERPYSSLTNSCFDAVCMNKFSRDTGILLPDSIQPGAGFAAWVAQNHSEAWVRWKCQTINSMVQNIAQMARSIQPSIMINLHAVPWRADDYDGAIRKIIGQDFELLAAHVDYISPMCYHHMVKREPAWIHDVAANIAAQANKPVLPSIQVGKAYLAEDLGVQEFQKALKYALDEPSAGVVFWNWNAIAESAEKQKIIQQILTAKQEN